MKIAAGITISNVKTGDRPIASAASVGATSAAITLEPPAESLEAIGVGSRMRRSRQRWTTLDQIAPRNSPQTSSRSADDWTVSCGVMPHAATSTMTIRSLPNGRRRRRPLPSPCDCACASDNDQGRHQRGHFRCVRARGAVRRSTGTREPPARRNHGDRVRGAHAHGGTRISCTGAQGREAREDASGPSRDSSAGRASRPRSRTSAASASASRDHRCSLCGGVQPRRHWDWPRSSTSRN